MYSLKWAQSAINKFMVFVGENRATLLITGDLIEQYERCKAKMDQIKEQALRLNQRQDAIDTKIKATRIEARIEVKDTRVWVKTIGGADKWAMRQNGFQ